MAAILDLENGNCFLTQPAPHELNWLSNGQVTVNLANGGVLSASRDNLDRITFGTAPVGSESDHERAWPHPAGTKPPTFLSFWPDGKPNGKAVDNKRGGSALGFGLGGGAAGER